MKLAHFSDIHVTQAPITQGLELKRWAALASYTLLGRGRHFSESETRIAQLLADVDAQGVDHAVCTGDLTGVAGEEEFARCAHLFGARLQKPEHFTVIPGNHDRYVTAAVRSGHFEQHFGVVSEGGRFPFVKPLPGNVSLVAIDVTRPTSVVDSSGLAGPEQLKRLEAILTDSSLKDRFVVLALHYGLLRANGQRDTPSHGLRDDVELMALIDKPQCQLDMVVHGHLHRAFTLKAGRRLVVNAGSATDSHVSCGYNVYEIDAPAFTVRCHRREWNTNSGRYESVADSAMGFEQRTRA